MTAAPASIDELGTRLRTGEDLDWDTLGDVVRWMVPFNLTGHPAITLPAPVDGMPVGIQLIGRLGKDERLLDVAEWAETALAEAS